MKIETSHDDNDCYNEMIMMMMTITMAGQY